MNVHIVCSFGETDRILPRMARLLAKGTGWSLGPVADPEADINYYFPYLELRKGVPMGRSAALFTHNELTLPGKSAIWDRHAAQVDLRVTWAKQYEEALSPLGPTVRITPPLDRDVFKPRSGLRPPNFKTVVGISGYVYSGGRKGEGLITEVLKTPIGQELDWRAIGRGWPRPLETEMIAHAGLPAFYQSLDLYLCPSLIEGIPYGPLEALACGVPVVIPWDVGLLDELGEVQGITRYEAGNVEALAAALEVAAVERNLADPEELRAKTERFTLDAWVDGHLQAFKEDTKRSEVAFKSDHGIYVVAYGEPARHCATRLIKSIRQHMPDTPVAVASDRPLAGADVYVAHPDEDLGGRAAKTKMWANAPEEWEYVLYLDADTELTAPIPFLFGALRDGWELVVCKDVKGYDLIHSLWRRDSLEHKMGWEAIGSDRALQLAGGVVGFRRTQAVQEFLESWYREWFREARRDQGALLRSMYAHPVRLLVLGNEWNKFTGGISPEDGAGIIHHRGGPARRKLGWPAGRLDDPASFARAGAIRTNRVGREGVIVRGGPQIHHPTATVRMTWKGPNTIRRISRTQRTYIFEPRMATKVAAEDVNHMAQSGDVGWEVEQMKCPVCHAPNGACRGDGLEPVKESDLVEKQGPMRMPRQSARTGKTGYIGEDEGLVEVYDRQRRFPEQRGNTLRNKLGEMNDDQLKELGVTRAPEEKPPELHDFKPNRGGVNCIECRKSEDNGDHLALPVEVPPTKEPVKVSGETAESKAERRAPAAERHTPVKAEAKG